MTRISQQQLESYLWGAATLLRGTIDAGEFLSNSFSRCCFTSACATKCSMKGTQVALKESGGDAKFAAYPRKPPLSGPGGITHWRNVQPGSKNIGTALQSAMRAY